MNATVQPKSFQGSGWITGWTVVMLVLLLAIGIFLALPFNVMAAPAWLLPTQAAAREGFKQGGPFLIVALLAAVIGLSEVTSTFSNYPREALRTNWARILVLTNAVAATLAYIGARIYTPTTVDPVLLAVGTGVGFQALIRTRFVLAKEFGGAGQNEEVSLNLGWLYDKFQILCKTQIDLELMNNRRSAVTRLWRRYPTVQELYGIAAYTIEARSTLSADEEKERRETLDKLASNQAPTDVARAKIALFILETGGQAFVDFLLSQLEATPTDEAAPRPAPTKTSITDGVVRNLVENYSVPQVVKLADKLIADPALKNWIEKSAEPSPGVSETQQKAAIGYRLVQEAGLDTVRNEVEQPGGGTTTPGATG